MSIKSLRIRGYRSLRDLRLQAGRVNVIVGPNGSGKSNLYRALTLLARSVEGRLATTFAQEGGMPSAHWAGPVTVNRRPRITFDVETDAFTYSLSCGMRASPRGDSGGLLTMFATDPEVKEEQLVLPAERGKPVVMLARRGMQATLLDRDGQRSLYPLPLEAGESALSQIQDPARYPETDYVRSVMRRWRFYHQFRLDEDSLARRAQVAVRTPILADDGRDLVCALRTIIEYGDCELMMNLLRIAFPESELLIQKETDQRLSLWFERDGLSRRLSVVELSDGTLKFLCLLAALLSTKPAGVLVLNEPENSLHPDLLGPLAEMIVRAGERSQIWVITHSAPLAERVGARCGERPIRLELRDGATMAPELTALGDRVDEEVEAESLSDDGAQPR